MDKNNEATIMKNDSDFEHLKVWQDNPNLKYYLSDKHWNSHVNQLLYAYLTSRYKGNEVGVYINLGLLNGSAFKMAHPDFSVAAPLTAIATHREWSAQLLQDSEDE